MVQRGRNASAKLKYHINFSSFLCRVVRFALNQRVLSISCPSLMSPLTDVPKSSPFASTQAPSPALSDEEVLGSKGQNTTDHKVHGTPYYERQLGDSEVSYYLQSRATGVNDMFVFPPNSERTRFT